MTASLQLVDPRLLERQDLTVDDLADLPEDLHYELIDGRLVLTPSAVPLHQNISSLILLAMRQHRPPDFYIGQDQSVWLDGRNERRPDVVVIPFTKGLRSPQRVEDVCLAVEVISPSSKIIDRKTKWDDYAEAGIPLYWIIDPLAERVTFTEFVLNASGQYRIQQESDQRVTVTKPWRITLDLPAWTLERDQLREADRP
ncbi:Uma2 family endonuclease [Actinoplanes sp. NPDC049596]|uniref:Uma2 family endonuclease n=1 Tax=unclassified Actinoplanes TaxID=2626549 RepID=UPI0034184C86